MQITLTANEWPYKFAGSDDHPDDRPTRVPRRPRTLPILDYSRRGIEDVDSLPSLAKPAAMPAIAEEEGEEVGGEEASGVRTLADAVSELNPRSIWLHDNRLTAAAAPVIGLVLSSRPAEQIIGRLNLSGNQLGDEGVAALLGALSYPASGALLALSLGVNGLSDVSLEAVSQELTAGGALSSLTELRMGGNPIGPRGALALAAAMCSEESAAAARLSTLHLGHTEIGDEGGAAIAHALSDGGAEEEGMLPAPPSEPSALKVLHLAESGLSDGAARSFATALSSSRCGLRELWLGGNPLGPAGCAAIVQSLTWGMSGLQRLWLDRTLMDDSAAAPLAAVLSSPDSALSEVWIGANDLTDEAAAALATALNASASNGKLRKLWMDHTDGLTLDGAKALIQATEPRAAAPTATDAIGEGEGEEAGAGGGVAWKGGGRVESLWLGGRAIGAPEKEELEGMVAAVYNEAATEGGEEGRPGGPLRLLVDEPIEEVIATMYAGIGSGVYAGGEEGSGEEGSEGEWVEMLDDMPGDMRGEMEPGILGGEGEVQGDLGGEGEGEGVLMYDQAMDQATGGGAELSGEEGALSGEEGEELGSQGSGGGGVGGEIAIDGDAMEAPEGKQVVDGEGANEDEAPAADEAVGEPQAGPGDGVEEGGESPGDGEGEEDLEAGRFD